jgi:outer membrane protein assembly factor BamB
VPAGERWTQRVGRVVGAPLVAGPLIVLGSGDRAVMALDAASGVVRWKHFTGDPPRAAPVLVAGRVVVHTLAGLMALDLATGATVWEQSGSARPLGEVGGELLVRATGADGCEWREASTGRVLQTGLPGNCVAVGGVAIEMRGGTIVAGWIRSEH